MWDIARARAYLEAWGKSVAFYSDKYGVFRVNQRSVLGDNGMTHFGRALHTLNIANSSQAKDRVERAHENWQDPSRLCRSFLHSE